MTVKTIKIIPFLFFILLVFPTLSWGGDKVYTNKDLQKYQDKYTVSVTVVNGGTITYDELMRRAPKMKPLCTDEMKAKWKARGGGCGEEQVDFPGMWKKPAEKPVLKDDEQVNVRIKGCQTLQESLDGKPGTTNAVVTVLRHGRTIEQICDTLGQGCKSCGEAPRQAANKQGH